MHEIDADSHVSNQFDPGDPGVPRAPTQVDADWLNAVQNELVNAIEGAGITLAKGTNTQLRKALGLLGPGADAGGGTRYLSGLQNVAVDSASPALTISNATGRAINASSGGNAPAVFAENTSTGPALRATPAGNSFNDPALDITRGAIQFAEQVNPDSDAFKANALMAIGLVKGWAHIAWNNGAPTLGSGMNMSAPGNPGTGQIQINLAAGLYSGAMVIAGMAGPGARYPAANDTAGKFTVYDSAGAAVDFAASSGFCFVVVLGRQ